MSESSTRTKELNPKYGCAEVRLSGPSEPDVLTRIKRRERERKYRQSAYGNEAA